MQVQIIVTPIRVKRLQILLQVCAYKSAIFFGCGYLADHKKFHQIIGPMLISLKAISKVVQ